MAENHDSTTGSYYEVEIAGHLSDTWAEWFEGLTFKHQCGGSTILSGEIVDQAALHGLLKKIRDLGMPLLSVNKIQPVIVDEEADLENKTENQSVEQNTDTETEINNPGPASD